MLSLVCGFAASSSAQSRPGAKVRSAKQVIKKSRAKHRIVATRRIKRGTRLAKNMASIGSFRSSAGRARGTAFVIEAPRADGTALVVTAHHVLAPGKKGQALGTVQFTNANNKAVDAKVISVVAADSSADFALVRIVVPKSLRGLSSLGLARSSATKGEVYSAGFARIWGGVKDGKRLVSASDRNSTEGREAITGRSLPKVEQRGRVDARATKSNSAGDLVVRLPNEVGSSGSPIMRRSDNRVIGMTYAGPNNRDSNRVTFALPVSTIRTHLKTLRPTLSKADRKAVDRLLAK
jgi:hypothetical protein